MVEKVSFYADDCVAHGLHTQLCVTHGGYILSCANALRRELQPLLGVPHTAPASRTVKHVQTFPGFLDGRVRTSYDRLGTLIDGNAPAETIGAEAAQLLNRLTLRYGAQIFAEIGRLQQEHTLIAWGRCPRHPEFVPPCQQCDIDDTEVLRG